MKKNEEKIKNDFEKLYEGWEHYLRFNFKDGNMYDKTKRFCRKEKERLQALGITRSEVESIRNIRNANAHSPSFLKIKKDAVTRLQTLVNNFCKTAEDIATPKRKIFSGNPKTPIREITKTMEEKVYTHVPIIKRNKFIGTFSENTVVKLYNQHKDKDNLLVKDIKDTLDLEEGTEKFEFLDPSVRYYEIVELFQNYISKGKRLGVIYLTKGGEKSGNIQGIITAWDLHKGQD